VVPAATTVGMAFSGGGSVPLVSLDNAGKKLAYTWPAPLPVPVLDGDTATYRNVFPDVDLQMQADTDGYHQLLVVRTAEAAKNPALDQVKLGVQAQGLRLSESAGGGLEAVDEAAGGVAFEAPQPVMWDSAGSSGTQTAAKSAGGRAASADGAAGAADGLGPGDASAVAPIDVEVSADGSELHLTPDQNMLDDAGTQFPVFIDPQTDTPKAASWTMVSRYWASSPQWRFNGDADAGVGYCGWDYCAPYDLKRLFYQFPTSQFAGKTVLTATFVGHEPTLRAATNAQWSCGGPRRSTRRRRGTRSLPAGSGRTSSAPPALPRAAVQDARPVMWSSTPPTACGTQLLTPPPRWLSVSRPVTRTTSTRGSGSPKTHPCG
jgi:hypothetical protein